MGLPCIGVKRFEIRMVSCT